MSAGVLDDNKDQGGSGNSGGGNTGDQGGGQGGDKGGDQGGKAAASWKDTLPDELKSDPSLSVINDIPSLVKSYVHSQKLIGKDKVVIPGKDATEEDWKQFYQKVGVPESADKYEIKGSEKVKLDEDFLKGLKETAHKAGLTPKQVQALHDWYAESAAARMGQESQQLEQETKTQIEGLKQEWGQAFQPKVNGIKQAIEHYGGKGMLEHVRKLGLGADVKFLKLMDSVAQTLKEANMEGGGEGSRMGIYTPAEALAEANKLMADPAYFDANHVNHMAVVQKAQELFAMAAPPQQAG